MVSRFTVPEAEGDRFAELARARWPRWRSGPASGAATPAASVDDPAEWVLVSEWDGVGAYRRALGAYEVKLAATPLLAQARDEAGAFEELVTRRSVRHQRDGGERPGRGRRRRRPAGSRTPIRPGAADPYPGVSRRPGSLRHPHRPPAGWSPPVPADRIDTIVSLAKRRGFVYPSSEIYGGQRAAWDYGPLGVELKDNIKRQWWRSMVQGRDDIVGLDSVDHPGPRGLGGLRPRAGVRRPADRVPVVPQAVPGRPPHRGVRGEARPSRRSNGLADVVCPNCGTRGAFTEPKMFNGLLSTHLGVDAGRVGPGLPAPGDRAGHLHQLPQRAAVQPQEAAVRHRPDRQVLPQRDHPGQLHLPDPRVRADGDGVLRRARHRRGVARLLDHRAHPLVHRPRHRRRTTCGCTSTRRTSCPTTRSAPSTSSTGSASAARSGASWRASPTAPTST